MRAPFVVVWLMFAITQVLAAPREMPLSPIGATAKPTVTITLAFHVNQPLDPQAIKETLIEFARREGYQFFSAASSEPPPPRDKFLYVVQNDLFKAIVSNMARNDRAVVTMTGVSGADFDARAARLENALRAKWPDLATRAAPSD